MADHGFTLPGLLSFEVHLRHLEQVRQARLGTLQFLTVFVDLSSKSYQISLPFALAFLIGSRRDLTGRPRCIFDLQGELLGPLLQLRSQDLDLLLRAQVVRSALFASQRRLLQRLHFLCRDAVVHALLSTHLTCLSPTKLCLREFTDELGRRTVV